MRVFAVESDPLPGIESLTISGEALPGQLIQACGFAINGTTSCQFKWLRYLDDGSAQYVEGADQPTYLVSANDVGSYLAIEVQPMNDRKVKGKVVKVFANGQEKITADHETTKMPRPAGFHIK